MQHFISCQRHSSEPLQNNTKGIKNANERIGVARVIRNGFIFLQVKVWQKDKGGLTNKPVFLGSCKQQTGMENSRLEARSTMKQHHTTHNTGILDLTFLKVLMSIFMVTSLDLVRQSAERCCNQKCEMPVVVIKIKMAMSS